MTLADTFNRAVSTTTPNPCSDGGSWTIEGGTWGISSDPAGRLENTTGGSTVDSQYMLRRDLGTAGADMLIENFRVVGTVPHARLWVSYDPVAQSGYFVEFNGNTTADINRYESGSATSLGVSVVTTRWFNIDWQALRLVHDGSGKVEFYQGPVLLASRIDPSPPLTGTWVGLSTPGTNRDYWRNFTAVTATPAVVPRGWIVGAIGFPQQGGPAIDPGAFINGAGSGGSGTTATVTMPSGLVAGDLLIASMVLFNGIGSVTNPTGWTRVGNDTKLGVWAKISDGTETDITLTGFSGGWAAELQIYRGDNIRIASSAFGPAISTTTSCDLPTAAVTGDPLAVEVWGGCATFSGSVGIVTPSGPTNVTSGTTGGREVRAGSEALTGVSTTPPRTATATQADDGWGAAVLTVAIDA